MSQLIYVETSIPSFYCDTRPSIQLQARREWTQEWWELARWRDALVVSPVVIAEIEETPDPTKREQMLGLIADLPRLAYADESIRSSKSIFPTSSCRSTAVATPITSHSPLTIGVIFS